MLGPDVGQIAKEAAAVCHPATDWPAVEVAGLTRNPRVHHFLKYNKGKAPYAEERYLKDAHRLYSVLDRQLAQHEFVADDYLKDAHRLYSVLDRQLAQHEFVADD